ncbi:MAM domain-containing glycosylphosphatidylinositol anchor protein 1 [Penaeus vannamei]|uniref:MAM domain-containing glycosylphosphatidylinositol anchor protein 1 n=1 Tax=Penaeus vannamei TaxID=6689 RepID=A0A3R7PID0_PENVA|nr:MAM domain-containing glycosylphosphatidylinositol anchor protein 1 [Penaeus vannamei]
MVYISFEKDGTSVLEPVWALKNHQGPNWMYGQARVQNDDDFLVAFEGTWGSSRGNGFMALDDITLFTGDCSTMPEKAMTSKDCDFQRDACQWKNTTTDSDFRWTTASISRRPATCPTTPSGARSATLLRRVQPGARPQSLTFTSPPWTSQKTARPSVSPSDLVSGRGQHRHAAPEWQFGQVQVNTDTDFRVSIIGMASNGGFAIDDIKTYGGGCRLRPEDAVSNGEETTTP